MPERIQLRRAKGWRLKPNARSVARPGYYGNPYRIGDVYLVSALLPFPMPTARTSEGPCGDGDTDLRAVRCRDAEQCCWPSSPTRRRSDADLPALRRSRRHDQQVAADIPTIGHDPEICRDHCRTPNGRGCAHQPAGTATPKGTARA